MAIDNGGASRALRWPILQGTAARRSVLGECLTEWFCPGHVKRLVDQKGAPDPGAFPQARGHVRSAVAVQRPGQQFA
jgi:hypothetical protein